VGLSAGVTVAAAARAGVRSQALAFAVVAGALLAPGVRQPRLLPVAVVLLAVLATGVAVAQRHEPAGYPRGLLVGVLVGLLAAVVLSGTGLAPAVAWAVLGLPTAFGAGVDWCRPSSVRVVTLLSGIPVVAVVVTGPGVRATQAGASGTALVLGLAPVWFVGVLAVLWSLERDGESAAAVARPVGPAPAPGARRLPDLVRVPVVALLVGVVVAVAAGKVPAPAPGPSALPPDAPLVAPSDQGDPVLPTPTVVPAPDAPDPPVTTTPPPLDTPPADPVADAGPLLLAVIALAALLAVLWTVVRRARRPAPGGPTRRWAAAAHERRRPRDGAGRRRRRPDPLGPPWAEDLRRRLEEEGARRGRPRGPAESVTAYAEALAATVLPDPRVRALGAVLSTAYFGPDVPLDPASWPAVLDELCVAYPI
jgi:hypothetical protein